MDEKNSMGTWGILILIFLLFIVFGGGLFGRERGFAGDAVVANGVGCGCNRVSNCEVERQEIIDSYNTQLNTINQSIITRQDMAAGFKTLADQSRGQYDAQQGEKIFDLKMENSSLKNMLYSNGKFDCLEKQISEIACNTPKRPPYWATGYVPDGERVPRRNGCNEGCGCGIA